MGDHVERVTFTWEGPGTPVREQVLRVEPAGRSFEALLADAPAGSVVTWRSPDAPPGHALERVPSLKLGADAFAAHGLSASQNVLTRQELCALLQAAVAPGAAPERVYPCDLELIDIGAPTEAAPESRLSVVAGDPALPLPLRAEAARALELLGDAGVTAAATFYLDHLDQTDAQGEPFAVLRLAELGEAALPALVAALAPTEPFERRLAGLHAVSVVGGAGLGPRLAELAGEDADLRVAQAAAEALGRVGSPDARVSLEMLLGHPSPNVRYGAVAALELLGDAAALGPLADLLEAERQREPDDEDGVVVAWWSGAGAGAPSLTARLEGAITALAGERRP